LAISYKIEKREMESVESDEQIKEDSSSSSESEQERWTETKQRPKPKKTKKKKGWKTDLWTRVFDGYLDLDEEVPEYKVMQDKNLKLTKSKKRKDPSFDNWQLIFDAEGFNTEHKPLLLADYTLDDNEVRN
jgi:hypothetical protein